MKVEVEQYLQDPSYLFDSTLLYRIQTYIGGKRKDLQGHEIHGQYDLVSVLTERALESVHWLEDIGVEFVRNEVTMPVGALWRRGHKPVQPMGYAFISVLQKYVLENGGTILTDSPVKELLVEEGAVKGVRAEVETVNHHRSCRCRCSSFWRIWCQYQDVTKIQYLLDRNRG